MVMVPVLLARVVFLDTEYFTVLFPVKLPLEVMVIHEALLFTVPLQLFEEGETVTLPRPPDLLNVAVEGVMLNVQTGTALNDAVTVFGESIITLHWLPTVTLHPVHPAKVEPVSAVAVNVMELLSSYVPVPVLSLHIIVPVFATTLPPPVPVLRIERGT
jgi:hypothetical protein